MTIRILDFSDGFQSSASPTVGIITADAIKQFVDDAAYVTAKGSAASDGDIYKNTTTDLVRFYSVTAAAFVDVVDSEHDQVISGAKTFDGATLFINTTNLEVTDKNININKDGNDASSEGAGLNVERTSTDGSLIYEDALASKWKAGAAGSEVELANVSGTQALTNKTMDGALNTFTNLPGSGADTDLNNLTATSVNQDLKADGDGTRALGTSAFAWALSWINSITSKIAFVLSTENNGSGSSDRITFITGSGTTDTGDIRFFTGDASAASAPSGNIFIKTGNPGAGGTRGPITLSTSTGNVDLESARFRRSTDNANFIEQSYVDTMVLADNNTAPISLLTYAGGSFSGLTLDYVIAEATGGTRVGQLRIVSDAALANVSFADTFTETADIGVSWAVAFNGSNIEFTYTTTSTGNARTMRADIKRFRR